MMLKKSSKQDKTLIKYDWLYTKIMDLISNKDNEDLSSRIRFKIQDVIDEFNNHWEEKLSLLVGHKLEKIPVHASEEHIAEDNATSTEAVSKPEIKTGQAFLLDNIRNAFGISDDDDDYKREVTRKISVNENNVVGINFQKYQDAKPSKEIRRKIFNFVDEYNTIEENKETALSNMQSTMKENDLEGYYFVGYALQYSFSMERSRFEKVFSLIIEFLEHGYLENYDLLEGLNVSVSNYLDTLIDYPETKNYVIHILSKLHELELLSTKSKQKYIEHMEKLENDDYQDY